jgi:hypothetical protein
LPTEQEERLALDDLMETEVGVAVAATAAAVSPRARSFLRQGAVYGLAGAMKAGDFVFGTARGLVRGAASGISGNGASPSGGSSRRSSTTRASSSRSSSGRSPSSRSSSSRSSSSRSTSRLRTGAGRTTSRRSTSNG